MSILVTGGSGLIGSRIVRDLAREGEQVIAFNRHMDQEVLDYVLTEEDKKNVKCIEGDMLDYEGLKQLCIDNGVDRIVHTASMMGNVKDVLMATQVNTGGMMRILEICRELKIKKLVFSSTNSVYNTKNTKWLENDAPFDPDTHYGCTKAFNEYAANLYYNKYGVDVTGIRISAQIFGVLQRRGLSYELFNESMLKPAKGEPGRCPYNDFGCWMYVDDVATAHVMALKMKREVYMPNCFNIVGTVARFEDMGEFVKKFVPDADIQFGDQKVGLNYVNADTSVTERILGFKPKWDIWDAFKLTINDTLKLNGFEPIKE